MDDINAKAKELMNKFSNPFKPKFKGQGHKLGGGDAGGSGSGGPSYQQPASRSVPAGGRSVGSSSSTGAPPQRSPAEEQRAKQQAVRWQQGKADASSATQSMNSTGSRPAPRQTPPGTQLQVQAGSGGLPRQAPADRIPDQQFECPVCGDVRGSETEMQIHVEDCLANSVVRNAALEEDENSRAQDQKFRVKEETDRVQDHNPTGVDPGRVEEDSGRGVQASLAVEKPTGASSSEENDEGRKDENEDLHQAAATLISASPPVAVLEIIAKLLRNILSDRAAEKFRRIRMGNPKISETIGSAVGGVEFLQVVGFNLVSEALPGGDREEVWAIMTDTSDRQLAVVQEALSLLEGQLASTRELGRAPAGSPGKVPAGGPREALAGPGLTPGMFDVNTTGGSVTAARSMSGSEGPVKPAPGPPRKADRKMRIFLPSPESAAARIDVPESFFTRTSAEVKAEAAARKKAQENSQMLVTRAWREKQALANKRRYSHALIRVLMPDMMAIEGVFYPGEPTSHLYEFVADALLDPAQEFQLVQPIPTKDPFIPSVASGPNVPIPTLEALALVPAALVKFRPIGVAPGDYTGLRKELILQAQPLDSTAYPRSDR